MTPAGVAAVLLTGAGDVASTGLGRVADGNGAVWWNTASGTIRRVDPATDRIVQAVRVTAPYASALDFTPLGIAAGAGAVWVTVTYGP